MDRKSRSCHYNNKAYVKFRLPMKLAPFSPLHTYAAARFFAEITPTRSFRLDIMVYFSGVSVERRV